MQNHLIPWEKVENGICVCVCVENSWCGKSYCNSCSMAKWYLN